MSTLPRAPGMPEIWPASLRRGLRRSSVCSRSSRSGPRPPPRPRRAHSRRRRIRSRPSSPTPRGWEGLDLMVLWFPRGGLPALRFWKPVPAGAFHAVYVLSERGAALRLVDVAVPRVHWEIRFHTHPVAVAIPLLSAPGTSGAPLVDLADGALVGVIVGVAVGRPELAAVVPAQSIFDALTAPARR